jgi:hypothetical protein
VADAGVGDLDDHVVGPGVVDLDGVDDVEVGVADVAEHGCEHVMKSPGEI